MQGAFHLVEAIRVAIKSSEIHPGARASVTDVDSQAIFLLRCVGALFFCAMRASTQCAMPGFSGKRRAA